MRRKKQLHMQQLHLTEDISAAVFDATVGLKCPGFNWTFYTH